MLCVESPPSQLLPGRRVRLAEVEETGRLRVDGQLMPNCAVLHVCRTLVLQASKLLQALRGHVRAFAELRALAVRHSLRPCRCWHLCFDGCMGPGGTLRVSPSALLQSLAPRWVLGRCNYSSCQMFARKRAQFTFLCPHRAKDE